MNKKTTLPVVPTLLMALGLCLGANLYAQEVVNAQEVLNPQEEGEEKRKPDEDKVNPLENVDINIIKRDDKVIETHSINGVVYKVKVTPKNAPPYYLYDTDGDGSLETRSNRELSETTVQQWKIFQW